MSLPAGDRNHLIQLLHDLRNGRPLGNESAWLRQQVLEDADARQLYVESLWLTATISWLLKGNDLQTQCEKGALLCEPKTQPLLPGFLGRWIDAIGKPVVWSVLAASLLFAAYFIGISWNMLGKQLASSPDSPRRSVDPSPQHAEAVATIRETSEVEWSPNSRLTDSRGTREAGRSLGERIHANQPLSITSGVVELQLKQGTTLLIEGPAEWSIDGENNATLKRGKLIAKVPRQAFGFTLKTPLVEIVDLGTEFGASVSGQTTEVQVQLGKVSVASRQVDRSAAAPRTLTAGQTLRIQPGREDEIVASPNQKFERLRQRMNHQPSGTPSQRFIAVSKLPGLVALYFCSRQKEHADRLINQVKSSAGSRWDGTLMDGAHPGNGTSAGPLWLVTPDRSTPGSAEFALWFDGKNDGVYFEPCDFGLQFTISAWICPEPSEQRMLVAGNIEGGDKMTGFALTVNEFNQSNRADLGKLVFIAGAGDGSVRERLAITEPHRIDFRRWQQIAVTVDAKTGYARIYHNGKPVTDTGAISAAQGFRTSGRWSLGTFFSTQQTFAGLMDEVAIFNRVLDAEEIAWLHN